VGLHAILVRNRVGPLEPGTFTYFGRK